MQATLQPNGRGMVPGGAEEQQGNPASLWGLTLPGTAVRSDQYEQTLAFVLACKQNDKDAAERFLRETLRLLCSNGKTDSDGEFNAFVGDEIDDKPTTLVLLVPGQAHIIGHLIGKAGSEISKLEKTANVTIRVESKSKMPLGSSERRIYVVGSVANCVYTQQMITKRIHDKLREEGVQQELIKIVIPHESVPHLIGKGGTNIKRLQELASARIQVEQETSAVPGSIGRAVTIQGTRYQRSMAQYFVARQMAENRSTRKEWQGGVPQPSNGRRRPSASVSSVGSSDRLQDEAAAVSPAPSTQTQPSAQPQPQPQPPQPQQPVAVAVAGAEARIPHQGFKQQQAGSGAGTGTVPYGADFSFAAPSWYPENQVRAEEQFHFVGYQGVAPLLPGDTDGVLFDVDPLDETQTMVPPQPSSHAQQHAGAHVHMQLKVPPGNPFHRGDFDQAAQHQDQDHHEQQYETLVPDTVVAHLIGRSGSVISEIQRRSQTTISFARSARDNAFQKVTIVGSPYAIQVAQGLISEKIVDRLGEDFGRV